jgi:nicotinate-nucleotide--dimethylbenzimidazole phosphoribosyltransferase
VWTHPPVAPIGRSLEVALRTAIDGKAKPPGSLGRIEDIAIQLGLIAHPQASRIQKATLLIFAGDHGLNEEGVSQYPSSVTTAMVQMFLAGRASANAFASACDVDIRVVDAGVAADITPHPKLISAKIRRGTANAAREPAMARDQALAALTAGSEIAVQVVKAGADVLCIGEMGIGNTASSSLIMHRLLQLPLDQCIGEGAGQNDEGMTRKRDALQRAAARTSVSDAFGVLVEFGGLEIAMMAGAIVGAASERRPVIVDGFIASVGALVAVRVCPAARDYCVFAHCSAEQGHRLLLDALDANPLLDLGLRLGEGTGAILAVPLLRAAARLVTDVANLADVLPGQP